MIVFDMLAWWYTTAWVAVLHAAYKRTARVFETFSVVLLAKTLFAPFRQIDAGGVRGPIDVQLRAWFDRTFSRFFGAGIRTVMIIAGCVSAAVTFLISIIWAAVWLVLPILPIFGLVMVVLT